MANDAGSLGANPVIIDDIVISAPEVTYELGPGGSNIDAIQRNIDTLMVR